MIVTIVPYGKTKARQSKVVCQAVIPIVFIKKLSGGAVDVLQSIGVKTIEDLHQCPKELIKDVVLGRRLQQEILAAKEKIDTQAKVKKLVIEFEYFARNKKIRIKSEQRAMLIAVSLFKEIISDLQEVIDLLLETKKIDVPFREQEVRKKLAKTCMYAIQRNAA